jgi:protein-disulfide isomerase
MAALLGIAQDKAASKKASGPASSSSRIEDASKGDSAVPLTPEISRRIENEIRSHYSVSPQVSISLAPPKAGKTPGYDDLVVTFTGGTHTTSHDFLLSKDRKTLAHLETMDISVDVMSRIDVKGRPIKGDPNATVTIVNYDDFECPVCSRLHSMLFNNVFKDYAGKVRVIYKDYPLVEIHPWAIHAAVDSNCLGEQNSDAYWDFADYVHANQRTVTGRSRTEAFTNLDNLAEEQGRKHKLDEEKLQACVKRQDESAVRASMAEGGTLGVEATPTLFINGQKFDGIMPEQDLRAVLDRDLAGSEKQSPSNSTK